jgi:hypothetical protein
MRVGAAVHNMSSQSIERKSAADAAAHGKKRRKKAG